MPIFRASQDLFIPFDSIFSNMDLPFFIMQV
jgi:hypothetical protein